METDSFIDFSAGDPSVCFSAAARYACNLSEDEIRLYTCYSDESLAKLLKNTCGFFQEMGLQKTNGEPIGTNSLSVTNGTTHGYEAALKVIYNRFRAFRSHTGNPNLKPVILSVLPTYGRLLEQPAELGMEILPIKRDPCGDWHLSAREVAGSLADLRKRKDRIAVAFFDSNPHNPSGLIRGKEETNTLADIFFEHNEIMREKYQLSERAGEEKNLASLSILDDMVYYGLEFDPNERPISFMTDRRLYDYTYLLLGSSKIGLPAFRGGLVVCNEADTRKVRTSVVNNCYCPNITAMKSVQYAFSMNEEELYERKRHLTKLREAHMYGEFLLRSLISGASPSDLATATGEKALKDVLSVVHSPDDAKQILTEGIKGLDLMTQPKSGFFHMAKIQEDLKIFHKGKAVRDDDALEAFLKDHGVWIAPGKWCGWDGDSMFMRLSFGLMPKDIVRCAVRTRAALSTSCSNKVNALI